MTGADGRSLDGATLHTAAARLAAALRAQGAGPGHTVAIALPQNVEQVVALAAVVYSGADFALIDLDAPPARAARFLDVLRPRCLVLDTDAPGGHQEELARTATAVVPVRTAYVLRVHGGAPTTPTWRRSSSRRCGRPAPPPAGTPPSAPARAPHPPPDRPAAGHPSTRPDRPPLQGASAVRYRCTVGASQRTTSSLSMSTAGGRHRT
ncbi:AMP-binding protein [Streptomyces zhihengii]